MRRLLAMIPVLAGILLFTVCVTFTGDVKSADQKMLVARMWHGRTQDSKANEYFTYLNEEGIKKIQAIPGNVGTQVFRRSENGITDFVVISYWNSREDIKKFAGNDIEKTHNLPRDPEFLIEMEPKVKHFDVFVNEWHKDVIQ